LIAYHFCYQCGISDNFALQKKKKKLQKNNTAKVTKQNTQKQL